MTAEALARKFEAMGARLKTNAGRPAARGRRAPSRTVAGSRLRALAVDVRSDARGEYFDIRCQPERVELEVLQVKPQDRHLLLLARFLESGHKERFLCGHDERHWFVAAIPEGGGVIDVRTAKEALMPLEVRQANDRARLGGTSRHRRKNAAHRRQGEWFFVPAPELNPPAEGVLFSEPLQRGQGKPHMAEYLYRTGGTTVYVSRFHPKPLTESECAALIRKNPRAWDWGWESLRSNPIAYVRGAIRHPDHRTLILSGWHRVIPNTEHQASASRHLAFLD